MYKLKGQSLNMRTGQGFKYRELVHPAGPSSWSIQLVRSAGRSSCPVQLVCLADPFSSSVQLINLADLCFWLYACCTMPIITCKVHMLQSERVVMCTCCNTSLTAKGALTHCLQRRTPSMRKGGGETGKKTDDYSGHYVIASSRPPERWNAARSCQY